MPKFKSEKNSLYINKSYYFYLQNCSNVEAQPAFVAQHVAHPNVAEEVINLGPTQRHN